MPTKTSRILSLSFGNEKQRLTPGKKLDANEVSVSPIIIDNDMSLGYFEVITNAPENINSIGEIIVTRKPEKAEPYVSLYVIPTLITGGLKGKNRLLAYEQELLYYLSLVEKTRTMLASNWRGVKTQTAKINQIERSFKLMSANLSNRNTKLPLEISAFSPSTQDSLGRPNPTIAITKLLAINTRLNNLINSTNSKADALQKQRLFGQLLLECYGQYIWDMQYLKTYSYDQNEYSKIQESQLLKRIELAKIKPFFFAAVYVKNHFINELGYKSVLPRVIEVFNAEVELCMVRDLLAKIADLQDVAGSIRLINVVLATEPNEYGYDMLYRKLHSLTAKIQDCYDLKEYTSMRRIIKTAKDSIRYRCDNYPDNPWYLDIS